MGTPLPGEPRQRTPRIDVVLPATADQGEIFAAVKGLLERYAPPLSVRTGTVRDKEDYNLWSERDVVVAGRPRKELFFAGLIRQKGYVGFYYMPVYSEAEREELFEPELLGRLKGKSCFHLRRLDDETLAQIDRALETGFRLYRERGWIPE